MKNEDITPYIRFLKSIQKPDLEGVWLDGQDCAENQLALEENPYPENSTEYHYWSEGWWAGFYEEEKLFVSTEEKTVTSLNNVTELKASNEPFFDGKEGVMEWLESFSVILGTFMTGMVCYELVDIAI